MILMSPLNDFVSERLPRGLLFLKNLRNRIFKYQDIYKPPCLVLHRQIGIIKE